MICIKKNIFIFFPQKIGPFIPPIDLASLGEGGADVGEVGRTASENYWLPENFFSKRYLKKKFVKNVSMMHTIDLY